jgi:hypothetical protein
LPNAFCGAGASVEIRRAQYGSKLFATVATEHVFDAQLGSHGLDEFDECGIPDWVTKGVVDALEVIDIQHEQA